MIEEYAEVLRTKKEQRFAQEWDNLTKALGEELSGSQIGDALDFLNQTKRFRHDYHAVNGIITALSGAITKQQLQPDEAQKIGDSLQNLFARSVKELGEVKKNFNRFKSEQRTKPAKNTADVYTTQSNELAAFAVNILIAAHILHQRYPEQSQGKNFYNKIALSSNGLRELPEVIQRNRLRTDQH